MSLFMGSSSFFIKNLKRVLEYKYVIMVMVGTVLKKKNFKKTYHTFTRLVSV